MSQTTALDTKIADQIPSIADSLIAGLISYVHRETLEVLEMADQESVDEYGEDAWKASRERVFEDGFAWISIQKLQSSESFRIMADFAESLPAGRLQDDLIRALNRSKPFRNFKAIIDSSVAREEWFAFRAGAYRDHVRGILEDELLGDEEEEDAVDGE